ncbi:MAG: GNAT family N-acetyltransferase [Ilumatobacter sp.]|nr:GNAT family N-acetyltransferase [Ilumatobacter sp.]
MTIRRATPDDVGRLSVTAMRAFVDDPVMRWLYPDDEMYLAPGGSVFWQAMHGWIRNDEVWCTEDGTALAVWLLPGRPEHVADPDADVHRPPSPELEQRFGLIGAAMAAHTPPELHWYLQLLATHPDWQRQGLGAELMRLQFARKADEGLPCYLETESPENVAYYRGHGFDVRSEWDVDPDGVLGRPGPHMWGMLRPVQ